MRCISAVHFEEESFWFLTAHGKGFYHELEKDGNVQILAYTMYKEIIRVSAKVKGVPFRINKDHCLQCGRCFENCPVKSIKRVG